MRVGTGLLKATFERAEEGWMARIEYRPTSDSGVYGTIHIGSLEEVVKAAFGISPGPQIISLRDELKRIRRERKWYQRVKELWRRNATKSAG